MLIIAFVSSGVTARFIIAGEGEELDHLKELSAALHCNTLFVGRKDGDELCAYYDIADVLVLPSVTEAFGAVVNEALVAGCRVVVSERCGSASIVFEDNGKVINPNDEQSVSKAISH